MNTNYTPENLPIECMAGDKIVFHMPRFCTPPDYDYDVIQRDGKPVIDCDFEIFKGCNSYTIIPKAVVDADRAKDEAYRKRVAEAQEEIKKY